MKLDYTTDYVWEDSEGVPYNIEMETTFDVTRGKSGSFDHPLEGPEINDIFVTVLHIEGVIDNDGHYDYVAEDIADQLTQDVAEGANSDLIEKVYDDVEEAVSDHA